MFDASKRTGDVLCFVQCFDEGRQPKLGDPLNDFVALVIEWSSKFVVLLFDLQDFLAGLC